MPNAGAKPTLKADQQATAATSAYINAQKNTSWYFQS
jgi:hypothetical protein